MSPSNFMLAMASGYALSLIVILVFFIFRASASLRTHPDVDRLLDVMILIWISLWVVGLLLMI